jgi:hypothetical protein
MQAAQLRLLPAGLPSRRTARPHADASRATARPKSAEGRDPDGDPPRQSNRVRQYPRNRMRRASSTPRDRAALPRSGMRDHRGNAFDDGGSNCRGSTAIQRPHRACRSEHLLLQLAAQIENAASWSKQRPPVYGQPMVRFEVTRLAPGPSLFAPLFFWLSLAHLFFDPF